MYKECIALSESRKPHLQIKIFNVSLKCKKNIDGTSEG